MKAHGLPDATLVCKGAYIMVHRAVLKQWTPWFEDKIGDLDQVDLESEDVWALNLLVHFCYTGIYDWRAAHYGTIGTGYVDCFVAHAVVYDLAVKLGIPELRDAAFEDFELDTEAGRAVGECR